VDWIVKVEGKVGGIVELNDGSQFYNPPEICGPDPMCIRRAIKTGWDYATMSTTTVVDSYDAKHNSAVIGSDFVSLQAPYVVDGIFSHNHVFTFAEVIIVPVKCAGKTGNVMVDAPEVDFLDVRDPVKWLGQWSTQFFQPIKVTFVGKSHLSERTVQLEDGSMFENPLPPTGPTANRETRHRLQSARFGWHRLKEVANMDIADKTVLANKKKAIMSPAGPALNEQAVEMPRRTT
jgi:hypothetical protein